MAVDNRNFVNTFANEGGADVLVEDKRMDELKSATAKTSSQISTSAQYIPLQDTDGNLVKINAASFQEAVRNTLGSLLANNDKGTTISGIPALSGSGGSLVFGSVSPANLASVLGVTDLITDNNYDFNNYLKSGSAYVAITATASNHLPVATSTRGLLTSKYSGSYNVQWYTECAGKANTSFQRVFANSEWSSWVRCDNFGCATASELASLLGVNTLISKSSGDLNSMTTAGEYFLSNDTTSYTNMPSNVDVAPRAYLSVRVIQVSTTIHVYQTLHSAGVNPNRIWCRTYDSANSWTSWAQVTLTTPA